MDKLQKLVDKRKELTDGEIFRKVFSRREVQILAASLLREQLNKGLAGDGELITNQLTGDQYYKSLTVEIYAEFGRRIVAGGHYTMRASGDFHASITLENVTINEVEIVGDTEKSDGTDLLVKFGTQILELTTEQKSKLANEINETIKNEVKATLLQLD